MVIFSSKELLVDLIFPEYLLHFVVLCIIVIILIQCQPFCSAVNNLPIGYPVIQQTPMPAPGQPHLDSMGCGLSSCHVVNGVPASGNFHPIRMNSGNE